MKNIMFYIYTNIKNPDAFRENQHKLCKELNLLGTILIAKEGINGCLSGKEKNIEKYKKELIKNKIFSDIQFKDTKTNKHDFKRLSVRIRKEIVASRLKVDIKNVAPYVGPGELKEWLDKEEDLILLDARNNYEYKIGKFRNAIHLNLDTFRQFQTKFNKLKKLKDKK